MRKGIRKRGIQDFDYSPVVYRECVVCSKKLPRSRGGKRKVSEPWGTCGFKFGEQFVHSARCLSKYQSRSRARPF